MRMTRFPGTVAVAVLCCSAALSAAEDFPLRAKFPSLKWISIRDLAKAPNDVVVVDVRDAFEFSTMHINGSTNLPVAEATFPAELDKLLKDNKRTTVVFYCNGHNCIKSYEAAQKARQRGYENALVYDAGILEWAAAFPGRATLLGKTPVDVTRLISDAEFDKHLLGTADFLRRAQAADVILFDARDPMQRSKVPDFGGKVPGNYYFNKLVPLLKQEGFKKANRDKPLFFFDATGKQVRWLQYLLEAEGYPNYWFLRDGVAAIYGDDVKK